MSSDLTIEEREEQWDRVVDAFAGRVGAGWIRADCPECELATGKRDKKQSMGLNTATGGYNCFKCGTTGKLPEHLLDQVPYVSPADRSPEPERPPVQLAEGYLPLHVAPFSTAHQLEPARAYLRSRGQDRGYGISDEVAAESGVGAVVWGRLRGRLIVPIYDYTLPDAGPGQPLERWRGWVSRDYTAWAHKAGLGPAPDPFALERPYMYPRNMDREGLLYNEPCLWASEDEPIFVVEGTLDTLALWPDSVAVLGKPLESQIAKLASSPRPKVICLDGDAFEEGLMLALKLRMLGARAGNLKLPPRIDPDQIPAGRLLDAGWRSLDVWGSVPVE